MFRCSPLFIAAFSNTFGQPSASQAPARLRQPNTTHRAGADQAPAPLNNQAPNELKEEP